MATRKPRYLLVWQDNLLVGQTQLAVDYLGTGMTITPFAKADAWRLGSLGRALLFAARLVLRRYDRVILPAIDFNWHADPSRGRRWLRKLIARVLAFRPDGKRPLMRWLVSGKTVICILDRYDRSAIQEDYARLVEADIYLKTNLTVSLAGDHDQLQLGFLPYWILSGHYSGTPQPRNVDLFFSAATNSEARRLAGEEIKTLQQQGFQIVSATGQLPMEEYLSLLQRSYLTLSPEGHGYHCFRHYEAMLSGSIPVINRPSPAVLTDLEDHRNCLFYDPHLPGDLVRVVKEALGDRPHLQTWGQKLREFALRHHSFDALGQYIVRAMETRQAQPEMISG